MAALTKVMIGVQARSTSTRYPEKINQYLGESTILGHVLNACCDSAYYLNNWSSRNKLCVNVALCIPENDPIKERFLGKIQIIEGSEKDVLSRYVKLAETCSADYIVRITSDCPLIIHTLISHSIKAAVMNSYDYLSNVDEDCRTAPDGYDCEVISRKLLTYTDENATDEKDREHVTPYIRHSFPDWGRRGFVINYLDRSDLKISIDTKEDEQRIQNEFEKVKNKREAAIKRYGQKNVHSFS